MAAVGIPQVQFVQGTVRDGHQPLLAALAEDAHEVALAVDGRQAQVDQLAHTQPAGEEHLYDGPVALALGPAQVYGRLHAVYLVGGEHFRQPLAQLGRLEQLGGVVVDIPVEH